MLKSSQAGYTGLVTATARERGLTSRREDSERQGKRDRYTNNTHGKKLFYCINIYLTHTLHVCVPMSWLCGGRCICLIRQKYIEDDEMKCDMVKLLEQGEWL
jgi:hypothetical protein